MSIIGRLLNCPAVVIERVLDTFKGSRHYTVDGEKIAYDAGVCKKNELSTADVARWFIEEEMGFDIVVVRLSNGTVLKLVDKDNSLIDGLRKFAIEKESLKP
jgi:hypothetical protein